MSQATTPTTKNTTEHALPPAKEAAQPTDRKHAFLDKPVADSFEDIEKYVHYFGRPGVINRPVIVSDELYDLLTNGDDGKPAINYKTIVAIHVDRQEAFAKSKRQTIQDVIIR